MALSSAVPLVIKSVTTHTHFSDFLLTFPLKLTGLLIKGILIHFTVVTLAEIRLGYKAAVWVAILFSREAYLFSRVLDNLSSV